MSIKPSHTLLAALAVIAGPAFAQDSATPETDAPAKDSVVQMPAGTEDAAAEAEEMANEAKDAAENAEQAVQDAADEMTGATDNSAAGDDAAASETPAAEDATAQDSAETETGKSAEDQSTSGDEATAAEATTEDSQTAADTESATPATEEAEAAAGESDEPEIGSYYAKSTHQDWTIRCIKAEEGVDPCELYQLLQDSDGNSVAEMTLIPLENGDVSAGATLVAPLETDLTRGLSVSIDSGEVRGYPFSFCAPVGCVSRMGFTGPELSELKRGANATISLLPFGADPENPVNLDLSLSGFTAAFDEMSSLAAEARAAAEAQAGSTEAPAE